MELITTLNFHPIAYAHAGRTMSAPNLTAQGTLHINNLIKRLDSTQFLTSNYHASHHNIRRSQHSWYEVFVLLFLLPPPQTCLKKRVWVFGLGAPLGERMHTDTRGVGLILLDGANREAVVPVVAEHVGAALAEVQVPRVLRGVLAERRRPVAAELALAEHVRIVAEPGSGQEKGMTIACKCVPRNTCTVVIRDPLLC